MRLLLGRGLLRSVFECSGVMCRQDGYPYHGRMGVISLADFDHSRCTVLSNMLFLMPVADLMLKVYRLSVMPPRNSMHVGLVC